jgi:hypothetical protein
LLPFQSAETTLPWAERVVTAVALDAPTPARVRVATTPINTRRLRDVFALTVLLLLEGYGIIAGFDLRVTKVPQWSADRSKRRDFEGNNLKS